MQTIPADLNSLLRAEHVPQQAFGWNRRQWLRWLGHLAGLTSALDDLPEKLDRRDAARLVQQYETTDPAAAFSIAMIWGHGYSNYGPFRTARVLTGKDNPSGQPTDATVLDKLHQSAGVVRDLGAVKAFRYLNNEGHIRHLGPAFFTKWLYFTSAGDNPYGPQAAPILDQLVIDWIHRNTHTKLRYAKTPSYAEYLKLLQEWGSPHARTAAHVEEAIFFLIRNDGAAQT